VLHLKELAQKPTLRRPSGQAVDSPQFTADRTEKNPRTGLRPMRGTKVDDTGSEMRLWEKRAGDTRQFA